MINRLKVAEGDLVIVNLGSQHAESARERFAKILKKWLTDRGLTAVEVVIIPISNEVQDDSMVPRIQILSVNDVFDDAVLNGKEKT